MATTGTTRAQRGQADSYRTRGGVTIHRTTEDISVAGSTEPLIDALDARRGVLLASSYEYPGRYTRWDIGFVDPPLELTSRDRDFALCALNERGKVLLSIIAPALQKIPALREEFWENVTVPGSADELNQSLEMAGRVVDFLELGELMCLDALEREESCGAHFREEYQTEDGEALRNDAQFAHVAAWEYTGEGKKPNRHTEPLEFEYVPLQTRSYK